ncbi:hypothetical protein NA78x_005096 [Anatilimnocola sp. NA78]|uniref:hypothetical protein n=1 Tax=Anatilimnocola sp. NA78 TaxID=3415683 RepID=UPI003CE50BA8
MMASKAEEWVCRWLRTILADLPNGASIAHSDQIQKLFSGLEYFLPQVLSASYPEWEHESLDGFLPLVARKTGDGEAEIFGLCIIISDQTLTPIHLHIQASKTKDEVSWVDCKLGEAGEHGMVRIPWPPRNATGRFVHALEGRAGTIAWVYKVVVGERRP